LSRRLAAAIAAVGLGACLAACGGSSDSSREAAGHAGAGIGATVRTADCADWREAEVAQRLATVRQLRAYNIAPIATGAPGPQAPGAVLADERAYDLLQDYCAQPFARGFKLYKLYGRAAGFAGAAD
jgi:hypothetical protein